MATFFIIPFLVSFGIYCLDLNPIEPDCFHPPRTGKRCCAGYRTIGGKCHVCIGSIGLECVKPCPVGYYGKQCSDKCRQCDICNATTGECSNETTTTVNRDILPIEKSRSVIWVSVLLGVFASVGSVAAVLFSIYVKERKKNTGNDVRQLDQISDGNVDVEDYDAIRYSCMMLEDDSACNKQKNALDRISYAKTQTIPNMYNKLSFNKSERPSMDCRPQELYNIADHSEKHMQCQTNYGEYVTVAADKATSCTINMKNYTKENEHCQTVDNTYDDVLNEPTKNTTESRKTNYAELPQRGKNRRKKPELKPKPDSTKALPVNPDSTIGNRPYSLANN
ncbi:uncharacterized protein [Magallana gigas]|uniref:uncharacterized protein isoform X1 n=1 Tax=Magallana gigas TaxID=29159 RepID=UPI00333EE412